jgi:hypothetical protein
MLTEKATRINFFADRMAAIVADAVAQSFTLPYRRIAFGTVPPTTRSSGSLPAAD